MSIRSRLLDPTLRWFVLGSDIHGEGAKRDGGGLTA